MSEEIMDTVERKKPGPKPKLSQVEDARARRERRRADIGTEDMKLAAPKREGFTRRWVNDVVGRVDNFTANGWDVVQTDGTEARHVGGQKNPLKAVLMEIPDEFYAEDQKKKTAKVVDPSQMAESKAKRRTDDSPEEYIPGGKDSALSVDKLR